MGGGALSLWISLITWRGSLVLKPILCEGALRHRNTRELYLNNLRVAGPNHAQLKTKQNRKQDNKTRHRDQNKVNE